MSDYNYCIKTSLASDSKNTNGKLWLLSFKEKDVNIIYSSALDISGYGKTEEEALESFNITLEEFFRYTLEKNTIKDELKRFGWKIVGNEKESKFKSPDLATMVSTNKDLEDLLANKEFRKFDREISIHEYV